MKKSSLCLFLYFAMIAVHYAVWKYFVNYDVAIFIKFYGFLTMIFLFVVTIVNIVKKMYPDYVGFAFLGLTMLKLLMTIVILNKFHFAGVPKSNLNFITPYLVSLLLETLYTISIIKKDEINH